MPIRSKFFETASTFASNIMRLAGLMLCVTGGQALAADDFCAVKVILLDPGGGMAYDVGPGIPVELVDPRGKVVSRTMTRHGEVEFCDFGFGLHTIVVDRESCIPVTLQHIRLRFGETQKLYVRLNGCRETWRTRGCEVYFRISSDISSTTDWPIPSARVDVNGGPQPFIADRYGRVNAALSPNSTGTFTVSAPGHQMQTVTIACKEWEEIDRSVVLKRLD